MKPYQEEYLALMAEAASDSTSQARPDSAEEFISASRLQRERTQARVERGTQLLRDELFPTLDDILSASPEEIADLCAFADKLANGPAADVGLNCRIRQALVSYARQKKQRDMLICQLYHLGMALYNLETSLSPNRVRLYSARMRLCFAEAASYFETEYDEITDPEIRGYIHRSMGNIALSYETLDTANARAKLAAVTRSICILSDPDVRAKTPSLPWELYLYKSHQERTSMLGYLRTGEAGPEVFAQVLESAQIVMQRQTHAARERGVPLQPRWQYSLYAARYHCGAMLLPELLDALYALSTAQPEDDFGSQGLFCHVTVPALFMEYSKELKADRERERLVPRLNRMLGRMFPWLARVSSGRGDLSFALRQFLYAYVELPGCMSFCEAAQNVFAILRPESYARMWLTGRAARELCAWAIEDCPERLAGLPGCEDASQVPVRREELLDLATLAGRLCDVGTVHFLNIESVSSRGLFEEEQMLLQLHAYCGSELLSEHASTALLADVAHGHHCHYDARGGYPVSFTPSDSPVRPLIWLVSVAGALAEALCDADAPEECFERIYAYLLDASGARFAPFVIDLLRAPERKAALREGLGYWVREAYDDLFRRREDMLGTAPR